MQTSRIRVFCDYWADPIWGDEGMIGLDDLPISADLRDDFRQWSAEWEESMARACANPEGDPEMTPEVGQAWDDRGRALTRRLQEELGPSVQVSYGP